jgi:hypothetical protein
MQHNESGILSVEHIDEDEEGNLLHATNNNNNSKILD